MADVISSNFSRATGKANQAILSIENNVLVIFVVLSYLYRLTVWLINRFTDCNESIECNTRQNILLHLRTWYNVRVKF